ncbi:B3 domain-containing protein [Apostasia shenzhenica]|uniref:B3 domain-containing protein n=1 Tax=Apostasia shenzhenica TaxID=1088818 RepID=A0A2I0A8F5_9ASPA|nr:B3 domain-containing protein [Apostasia shenzhenica]
MEAPINSYEEIRRKRVEENVKKLEGFGIAKISKSLMEVARSETKLLKIHTSSVSKKMQETSELRRSSRARNLVPSYSDDVGDIGLRSHIRRRLCDSMGREYNGRMASYEERVHAVKKAEMLLSQVASDHPSFVKSMVRSHVSSCFWLGLPTKFCKDHLPQKEITMVLEDEKGEEREAIYIGRRTGLSGGWKSFAVHHELEDGDAIIFKLIEPTRFKIYIVKAIDGPSKADEFQTSIVLPSSKQFQDKGPRNKPRNARKRKQRRPRSSN